MPREPTAAHAELTENGVVLCLHYAESRNGSVEMWSQKETIAWGPCTPPPTLETFNKKIIPSTRSYRDSGFTEEEADDDDDNE